MKRTTMLLIATASLALAACVSTPELVVGPSTNAQGQTVQPSPLTPVLQGVAGDIQGAAYNLDQAIAIGVLPADDPAAKCAHDALKLAGIEVAPGSKPAQSFVPKQTGPLSDAATLYIIKRQAANSTGITIDTSCKAVLGQLVIDGLTAFNKTIPGLIVRQVTGL